jgi:hypothetical protein
MLHHLMLKTEINIMLINEFCSEGSISPQAFNVFVRKMQNSVLSRYNKVGYSEQRDIVYTFRYFGWFAVELMLKNCVYSELGYIKSRVIMKVF